MEKLSRALKPDAQGFDEVRITTVPRYKESHLSGDEWRISAKVELLRKGEVRAEFGYGRNIESAIMGLGSLFQNACDDGKGFFAGEADLCDQEGCSNKATIAYKLKKAYDRSSGQVVDENPNTYRCFCDRHRIRGDCGLDDADSNYEEIPIPAPKQL